MDEASVGNSKVNRGCSALKDNRISTNCDQNSPAPSMQCIQFGVYHTGGFNAMIHKEMYGFDYFVFTFHNSQIKGDLRFISWRQLEIGDFPFRVIKY